MGVLRIYPWDIENFPLLPGFRRLYLNEILRCCNMFRCHGMGTH